MRAIALALLLLPSLTAQPQRRLIYGGDAHFPPYEYLDSEGRPRGFNIQLVQAIARESGFTLEVRLADWKTRLAAMESGEADFISLARSDARERKYDFVTQHWTLHQAIVFQKDRSTYPRGIDQLSAELIAVEDGSIMHELLKELPSIRRPALRLAPNQVAGLAMLLKREVTAAAGNNLTLQIAAHEAGVGALPAISIKTLAYGFATRKGHAPALQALVEGLAKLQASGEFERLVEANLTIPAPAPSWREYAAYLSIMIVAILLVVAAAVLWNRSLRWQVATRTRELRESEQAYESLINRVDGIVWESDLSVEFRFVSAQAQRILGYPLATWLEPGFVTRLVLPEDAYVFKECQEATAAMRDHQSEFRARAADGRVLWIRNFTSVIVEGGRPVRLQGVMIDVTERRHAEEALRISEAQFRDLAETLSVGIVIHNGKSMLFANRAFQEISGYGPQDVTYNFVHPDFQEEVRQRTAAQIRGEVNEALHEIKVINKSGRELWVQNRTGRATFQGAPAFVSTLLDITQRKEAEEALRRSEERLELAMNAADDGYWDWDMARQEVFVSPRVTEMLGYPMEELRPPSDDMMRLVHPEDTAAMHSNLVAHLKGVTSAFEMEMRLRTKTGEWKWVLVRGKVVARDPGNWAVRATGTNRDITERKQLEEQLQQAQKMEAVGRLAGGVAHDFNNLLTVIKGYAAILREEVERPMHKQASTEIERAANRAAELTSQLLAFSRRQMRQPRVLDLNTVVEGLDTMMRRLIGEDIRLEVNPAPNLGKIRADHSQIEQVVMNLLVNARDAMPSGGTLRISTMNTEVDDPFAAQHRPLISGSYVTLTVSDTGEGMDSATQTRIFEPFFTTKEKGKGTGLGLAMVYGIVKQNEGYIWVRSQAGQGATFDIYLPRVFEDVTVETVPAAAWSSVSKPSEAETILVVEDEAALRELAEAFLVNHGYQVLAAGAGEEALEIANRHVGTIDLLVTDVVMQGMNGRQLAERLSQQRPEMAVLFISGYSEEFTAQLLANGVSFLQKPFGRIELLDKVREALDRRSGAGTVHQDAPTIPSIGRL